jgi:hypothetical protein
MALLVAVRQAQPAPPRHPASRRRLRPSSASPRPRSASQARPGVGKRSASGQPSGVDDMPCMPAQLMPPAASGCGIRPQTKAMQARLRPGPPRRRRQVHETRHPRPPRRQRLGRCCAGQAHAHTRACLLMCVACLDHAGPHLPGVDQDSRCHGFHAQTGWVAWQQGTRWTACATPACNQRRALPLLGCPAPLHQRGAGVDVCAQYNGGCSADATCALTYASRSCACKLGFSGNGITCTREWVCMACWQLHMRLQAGCHWQWRQLNR